MNPTVSRPHQKLLPSSLYQTILWGLAFSKLRRELHSTYHRSSHVSGGFPFCEASFRPRLLRIKTVQSQPRTQETFHHAYEGMKQPRQA